MRTTAYACDRCGERIDTGRAVVVIDAGPRPSGWPTDPETGRPAADLCGPCLDALWSWLREPARGSIVSEGQTNPSRLEGKGRVG